MFQLIRALIAIMFHFLIIGACAQAEVWNKTEYYSLFLLYNNYTPKEALDIELAIDQRFTWLSNSVQLDSKVLHGPNDVLVYKWTQLSGPGVVIFSNPFAKDTTVTFPVYGETYVLQLSVSDGELTSNVQVTVRFNFLANYTNREQQKLPANRVYPMGQKMMLTPWTSWSEAEFVRLQDAGFTMQGPNPEIRDLSYIDLAIKYNLRSAHRLAHGVGTVSAMLPHLDDGEKEARIYDLIREQLTKVLNNTDWNNNIDIWMTGTEEISTRNQGNVEKLNRYLRNFKQIIEENDPQKRPLWMSDSTGVTQSAMMVTHPVLDMVGPQIYLNRTDPDGGGGYTTDAIMGYLARNIVSTANELDAQHPVLRPRPATGALDALYEPVPARDNAEFINKVTEHNIYLGLNNGMQGYQFYSWEDYTGLKYADTQTWNWLKDAYHQHVKLLTDNSLDYVYLWGDKRSDLSMKILNGPDTTKGFPSISMQNIQYGDHRYVMITNSADIAVQVEVSGFPYKCIKVQDIHLSEYIEYSSTIITTLQPLDVRLYRFDPEDACSS